MRKSLMITTAPAVSGAYDDLPVSASFQATVKGTGPVSATVVIEASNDAIGFLPLGTITLSGTTVASDGFVITSQWGMVRANVTSITGTGATVYVTMGA